MASWTTDKEKGVAAIAGLIAIGLTSVITYLIVQLNSHEARLAVLENTSQRRDVSEQEFRREVRESLRRLEDALRVP